MNTTGSTTHKEVIIPQKKVDRKDMTLANAIIPFQSLTEAQKRFVVAYAGGLTQVESYMFAYPDSSIEIARKKAYSLLKNEKIAACAAELSSYKKKKYDFSRDAMGHRLMLLFGQIQSGPLNSKDRAVLLDIYKEINKMYGNYSQPDVQVNIQPVQINIIPTPSRSLSNNKENIEEATYEELPPSNDDLDDAQQNIQDFLKD